ncbi:MAG: SAM-dependent methyltransferase [Sphingomonadales bacterium]|nr:SAM-dependent methyltransferase [Sphingomonadales bacterium]MDE2168923.1 SAM-dependent methyltransferase [Sphingomonadales bacterium]
MARLPLGQSMARLIAMHGPISLLMWMGEANAHYYGTRDPLGAKGDFTTAPEISQMFGEMIGVWLADVWQRAGGRPDVAYVELGPGRGTLAADALRVLRRFGWAGPVHFVETSPTMRAAQARAVPEAIWHDDLTGVPEDAPLMIVANEFLDALPVRQMVKTPQGWRERMVGMQEERFVPMAGSLPMDLAVPEMFRDAPENTIVEASAAASAVMGEIGHRLATQGGAGLIVDYGYLDKQTGSSLQALRGHAAADPFADPGEVDLTTLVDFHEAAQAARAAGAQVAGPVGQGAFLGALGIAQRAASLARSAPERTNEIAQALDRLVGEARMGTLFKVMGLAGRDWPMGAGF